MLLIRKSLVLPTCVLILLIYFLFYNLPPGADRSRTTAKTFTTTSSTKTSSDRILDDDEVQIHWTKHKENYPVSSYIPLPTAKSTVIPKIQYDFPDETSSARKEREERRNAVKKAFKHAWKGYKENAWLKDELAPISGGYRKAFSGWAATLVDTLDTLLIMDMEDEFEAALPALDEIDFTTTDDSRVSLFETTIRYLGGLLSAYDLSKGKYPILLKKATELGEILYSAFDTPNRMPMARWEWMRSAEGLPIKASRSTLIAELGSLSMEFTRLTQLTKDPKYFDAVQRITNVLEDSQKTTKLPGLWPVIVDAENLEFTDNRFTMGGMADSTYEYLPKEHLLLGGQTDQYQRMYEAAIEPAKEKLFFRPMTKNGEDLLISGNAYVSVSSKLTLEPSAQHLTCFIGGMVGIAAKIFERPEELPIARKLVDGCIWAYDTMPSGLMPEIFYAVPCRDAKDCKWDEKAWYNEVRRHFGGAITDPDMDPDEQTKLLIESHGLQPGMSNIKDTRYMLRPEAIESVFIMYRITGDRKLQDAAWRMFKSIDKLSRAEYGHAAIEDVRSSESSRADKMESFWLAETLKYFYLIFSEPDLISMDEYVFNTEAHPFKRPASS